MSTDRELRDIARHEAGHALAHWWNGQTIHAIEMRPHEEGRPRVDWKGRGYAANNRAAVEGVSFIAGPSLLPEGYITMEKPAYLDTDLREWVERDLLHFLAGPAAEWRNEKDGNCVYGALSDLLDEEGHDGSCGSDMRQVDALLNLFPEEERETVWLTACRRAEALVCRYWPELCALADKLTTVGRLEDDALDAVLAETLGEMPGNLANPLEDLDRAMILGGAKAVTYWNREAADGWHLVTEVDGMRLVTGLEVVYMPADEVDELCLTIQPHPSGWYWMSNGGGSDDIGTEAPPAEGALGKFLSSMVAEKLAEMRRDPDYLATQEEAEAAQ